MFRIHATICKSVRRTIWAAVVTVGFIVPARAEPLDMVISSRPPYYIVDDKGTVSGIIGELTAKIFEMAGLDIRWTVVSFKRQLQMIEDNTEPLCGIGWFKNPERENYAKFTDYIYQDKPLIALGRIDNDAVTAHSDLRALMGDKSLTMGMRLGFSYGVAVDGLIKKLAPKSITTDQSNVGMARMLIGRRFDYIISAPEEAAHLIGTLGADGQELTMIELMDLPPQNKRYIICSQRVDDEFIKRLNSAIINLRR